MFAHGEEVAILEATETTDDYGNTVESWDAPTTVAFVQGVAVEPRPAGESFVDSRNAVTSGFTLYFPPGTAVTAQQRIAVRGEVWPVQGDPAEWRNPFTGWVPGVVVQVGRTDG